MAYGVDVPMVSSPTISYASNYSFGFRNSVSDLVNAEDLDLMPGLMFASQLGHSRTVTMTEEEDPSNRNRSYRAIWLKKPRVVRYSNFIKIK